MNRSRSLIAKAGAVALVLAAAGTAGVAQARSNVFFSVSGAVAPGVVVSASNYGVPYYQPAPVYYQPAPVYYEPAPVYYPQSVYVAPAPVYYGGYRYHNGVRYYNRVGHTGRWDGHRRH